MQPKKKAPDGGASKALGNEESNDFDFRLIARKSNSHQGCGHINHLAVRIWCAAPSRYRIVRLVVHAIRLRSFSLARWVVAYEDAPEVAK